MGDKKSSGFCGWCCIGFFGFLISFIALLIHKAYEVGEFFVVNEYNIKDKCYSFPTPNNQACEDLQMLSDGSMLMSCSNLHDVLQTMSPHYIPFYNYQPMSTRIAKLPKSKRGGIYRISASKRDGEFTKPVEMKLSGYVHPDFNVHGMSVVRQGNQQWLYVVNHRRDGEFLSVFKIDVDGQRLKYWTSVTSKSFYYINNLAVIPDTDGNFYVSNWLKNDPGSWTGLLEIFQSKLSQVLYCETGDDFMKKRPSKNVEAQCKVVVDELPDANGVTLTNDHSKLFVVSGKHVLGYDIDAKDKSTLLPYCEIDTIYPCDNINPSGKNENNLYVACFPQPFSLLLQTQTYPNANIAAMIRKISIDEKKSTPFRIDTNGSLISGATAAIHSSPYTVWVSYFDTKRYVVCPEITYV